MKNKRENRYMQRLLQAVGLMAVMCCVACDPVGTGAMNRLGDLLNSEEGPTMPIGQLMDSVAYYNEHVTDFSIHFPLTATDERPRQEGCYVNPVTGSKLTFHLEGMSDGIGTIGTVDIEQHKEGEVSFGNGSIDSCFTKQVQARGRGVYALYYNADSVSRSWSRVLLFVYPGGDSLMTTRGTAAMTSVFRYQHD